MSFGSPHRHYARTDSTNTRARELAAGGAPGGTVVTATEQTAGRGRQGRSWNAPAGKALLYSAVLKPLDERHMLLPLAVPLAVCEAAERLRPDAECKVKWPNDVLLDGGKLAGVLIEARPQDGWAVIGVGLNLTIAPAEFPPDLRDRAVSLLGHADSGVSYARIAPTTNTISEIAVHREAKLALDAGLSRWVGAADADVLEAWRERDALRERQVAWDGGSGVADGVDDRGYLLVVVGSGERVALGAGEVHLSRA